MGPFFVEKKSACGNVPTSSGLPKIEGPFFLEKKAPAAMYPQAQGFKNMGAIFLKKGACGNVPTS